MKLKSWAKTSAQKAAIYVPLNTAVTYDQTKELSHALAEYLEREHTRTGRFQDVESVAQRKSLRRLEPERRTQDDDLRLFVRAKEHRPSSTPVTWKEVEKTVEKEERAKRLVFRCEETLERVEKLGDLFEEIETLKQKLPKKWKLLGSRKAPRTQVISLSVSGQSSTAGVRPVGGLEVCVTARP